MVYYRCDYCGSKQSTTVMIAAADANQADKEFRNYLESFLIPRIGPSDQESVMYSIANDEYWGARNAKRNTPGEPRFIGVLE